jgi:hypothetical protein
MMSSGSTVLLRLRHLLDRADLDRLAGRRSVARARRVAVALDADLGRRTQAPVGALVGLVHHHALREQAGERLVERSRWPVAFIARVKKRE